MHTLTQNIDPKRCVNFNSPLTNNGTLKHDKQFKLNPYATCKKV